jgi:hypothetical protein
MIRDEWFCDDKKELHQYRKIHSLLPEYNYIGAFHRSHPLLANTNSRGVLVRQEDWGGCMSIKYLNDRWWVINNGKEIGFDDMESVVAYVAMVYGL